MRKIAEIRRDLAAAVAEVKAINPEDVAAVEKGVEKVNALMKELADAEIVEKAAREVAEREITDLEKREGRQFSFAKFLREASDPETRGQLTGLEAEVAKRGAEEFARLGIKSKGYCIPASVMYRAVSGNAVSNTADIVTIQPATYVEGLRDALVISQMGAQVLGDLVGNVPMLTSKALAGGWGAEGQTANVEKLEFTKVTMTPKRNFVAGAVTRDLLVQTSLDVEKMIQDEILYAHARLIDTAAINGTGGSQPTGILNTSGIGSVVGGTNGAEITWKHVVALETEINAANANRGKLGYLTNGKVNGSLKVTEKASGSGRFILDGDYAHLNGYPFAWSNLVPSNLTKGTATSKCSAMIFGNWQDLIVGHWGGLDIIVDPYTKALEGEVRIVLNSYDDVIVREPKSFAAIKDILA